MNKFIQLPKLRLKQKFGRLIMKKKMNVNGKYKNHEYCVVAKIGDNGRVWICSIPKFNLYYGVKYGDLDGLKKKGAAMVESYFNDIERNKNRN